MAAEKKWNEMKWRLQTEQIKFIVLKKFESGIHLFDILVMILHHISFFAFEMYSQWYTWFVQLMIVWMYTVYIDDFANKNKNDAQIFKPK